MCQSFEAFREISSAEFGKLPFGDCLIVENPVLRFHRKIVLLHPEEFRRSTEWGESYFTKEEYWRDHPDAKLIGESDIGFPYFEAKREPRIPELQQRICPSDSVTQLLIDNGVPPEEVVQILAYQEEECGDGRFHEIYRLRPLWATYLAITNLSGHR